MPLRNFVEQTAFRYHQEHMGLELPKTYDPKAVEEDIAARWERDGYGNPDNLPPRHREVFVVMMPPPNVTGTLHLGHALEASLTDCLVRWRRMLGFKTLYLPGMDHAGIATQNAVEKELKKEGKTRFDLGREKFVERVWKWKEEYGGKILEQFKRLGVSVDWSRERFTMDEGYVQAVEAAFAHYRAKGWIYKGTRVVNWCPRCATSLSDLELEYKEEKGKLYYLRYPIAGNPKSKIQNPNTDFIVVATTRPETMLGDTAVAVHPDDKRYKALAGKTALLPLTDREIPVVADEAVDKDYGTGAVKVTPGHDMLDQEIGERHKLPTIKAINEEGRMTDAVPEPYRGMTTQEARDALLRDLEQQGLVEKTEDIIHNVAHCHRCDTVVEPMPSEQWFLKMSELAGLAAEAYRKGEVRFQPERWKAVALKRLEEERDWCISRQLWWGHRIPIEGEEDVLDTWFSSALWPFATLGYPAQTEDLKNYYPTQWMTSARDILFLWINRMVFSGIEFLGKAPFADVFIHPTVLTKEGKRMSKSLGTGLDPLELINEYGADAVRFGLLWQTTGVQDIRFDQSAILAGRKFLNKLWNAARYILGTVGETTVPTTQPEAATDEDRAILNALAEALTTLNDNIAALRFGQALEGFYEFFWHTFCDRYLEQTKVRSDDGAHAVLLFTLSASLRALHPFIPFLTDELWSKLPHREFVPLMIAEWPTSETARPEQ